MSKNRLLQLHEELVSFKPSPSKHKGTRTASSLSTHEPLEGCPQMSEMIVDDNVFILDILEYFFNEKPDEKYLTEELGAIAAHTLTDAIKASKAKTLIPSPTDKPSVLWLASEAVQIGFRKANNACLFKGIKNEIGMKWRERYDQAVSKSKTGYVESKTYAYDKAIGNLALIVFLENTGALPFQWDSKIGKIVQQGLEKIIDYLSEEFAKWLNKFKAAKGKHFKEVIILEDAKATYTNLKWYIHDLAKKGYVIDIFTLTHGNRSSFSGYKGSSISDSDLRKIRDEYGSPLPIRAVYMMNCQGSGLNDDWQYVGAKTVAGSLNNNYIPEPMMSKFWNRWQSGETFASAVNGAYNDSVKLILNTIDKAEDYIPVLGSSIKKALSSHINPLLADSKPVIEGNSTVTIETANLASAQALSLDRDIYSEAKYGTGEHVLAGLVDETPVSPTYTLDVNGVKFTYAELIAMGDLYDAYSQMAGASKTELARLKTLIDKSKRFYESKIKGKTVGVNTSDKEWQGATGGRYLKLAEDNFSHFAPSSSSLITGFSSKKKNHKQEWEHYHAMAIDSARKGTNSTHLDKALVMNAFGDHFLTDAFAAGHLFNKDDLNAYFKSRILSGGKINSAGDKLFTDIANKAFTGKLKSTFSDYETEKPYDAWWNIVNWNPNINSADRFKKVLVGIMEAEPDVFGKTLVAKLVHDILNEYPGGVAVTNGKGNTWMLTGDGTLNQTNLDIMRQAVKQSIRNVSDSINDKSAVSVFFKKAWDYVPVPTTSTVTFIKKLVDDYTNPTSSLLINGAAKFLTDNYQILLDELVARKYLKKA